MPALSSNSRSSSSEDSPTQGVPARQKTKFCMYHLQGVCRFAAGGCAYAHSTEEMQMGRTRKVRKGRVPPTSVKAGPSGHAQSPPYDATGTDRTFVSGYQQPTPVQPAYFSQQEYLAATIAQQWASLSTPPVSFGHSIQGASKSATTTLVPPPGLESTPFPQYLGHGPPLPTGLTYQRQGPYFAELSPKMVDLAPLSGMPLATRRARPMTMAEWSSSGDEPPMEVGTSEAELHLLSNLVHNLQHALLMTSPNMGESVGNEMSRDPPGLSLPA